MLITLDYGIYRWLERVDDDEKVNVTNDIKKDKLSVFIFDENTEIVKKFEGVESILLRVE